MDSAPSGSVADDNSGLLTVPAMVEDEIDVNGIEYDFVNKVVLLKKTQPTKPKIEEKEVEQSSE